MSIFEYFKVKIDRFRKILGAQAAEWEGMLRWTSSIYIMQPSAILPRNISHRFRSADGALLLRRLVLLYLCTVPARLDGVL